MDEPSDYDFFLNMLPNKTYVGKSFTDHLGQRMRIAKKVVDGQGGLEFATVKGEQVVRQTDAGRYQIKATFMEDDRSFQTVTLQKFSPGSGQRTSFTFSPREVEVLLKFLSDIKRLNFPRAGKININDDDLEELLLQPQQVRRLASSNPEMLAALARTEITEEDVVALGYRKKQLGIFHQLLTDPAFFFGEVDKHPKGAEQVWQNFFEGNPWIFGYGLSLIHFGPLDGRKLEQTVQGASIWANGKRVDAFLRSTARVSTSCFVEIKRHDTELLKPHTYRTGIWQPSDELTGAVSQVQGTVAAALDQMGFEHGIEDGLGNPTGEIIHSVEPRSFVIVGSLEQFATEHGINSRKFRSFELYRRNLVRPEVVTFDELYQRALLITDAAK